MNHQIIARSPAKLNLMLRVLDQLPNGYHNLQTVFQFIDLEDTLVFKWNEKDLLKVNDCDQCSLINLEVENNNSFIHLEDNLIIRAYKAISETKAFKEKRDLPKVKITLDKKIPIGAGLGGGSSNCAITLLTLNKIWQLSLSNDMLQEIGKQLGADVPVFIFGKSAWAEGIGEKLVPVELPEKTFGLIFPQISIETKPIFQSTFLKRDQLPLSFDDFLHGMTPNDCQSAIFNDFPIMEKILNKLTKLVLDPQITGTGSCIFLRNIPNENQIKEISQLFSGLQLPNYRYWQVKTRNRMDVYL